MIGFLKRFFKSFQYGGRGIALGISGERNLRLHLIAVFYVTCLGLLGDVGRSDWTALCLCFGLVIGLELLNSAVERACDAVTTAPNEKIRAAKDLAAGAVLAGAIASVGVAIVIFSDGAIWARVWQTLTGNPVLAALLLLTLPLALFFWMKGIPIK